MLNRWECFLGYIAYQAWAVGLGAFWFYFYIASAASPAPDFAKGMTARIMDRGEAFFVHPWQQALFWGALFGSVTVFMVAVGTMHNQLGNEAVQKFRPVTMTLAIIIAVVGWALVVRLR